MPSDPVTGGLITTAPVETDESGELVIAEQSTRTVIKHGLHAQLLTVVPTLYSVTTDGYKVISARLTKQGAYGVLTIVYSPVAAPTFPGGSGGSPLPEDTWSLSPQSADWPLERHTKFFALTTPEKYWWSRAFGVGDEKTINQARSWITANGSNDAKDFMALKINGQDTFPASVWRYTWVHYDTIVPDMADGNIIEWPYGPGAPYIGADLDWKREPDDLQASEGLYVVTRSWLGAPAATGGWSTFLLA